MISIVIPVYNAEKHLHRCLDSVLNQTYPDWECVMIDDGSKDSSGEICDEFAKKDSRFKVIHQKNSGVSVARNAGLAMVSGEWVTFSDSDDELTPNALCDFTEAINRYPNAQILRGGHRTITAKGRSKDRAAQEWISTRDHSEALKLSEETYCSGFMWSTCFHRDILRGETFENDITWCEDHIFTYRCMLKATEIVFVPAVVYVYYLDDRFSLGFGESLSFKPIDFNVALKSALIQKDVKLLLAEDNTEMQKLVKQQYADTVRISMYYALFKLNVLQVCSLSRKYECITIASVVRLWLSYYKQKIFHAIKLFLK